MIDLDALDEMLAKLDPAACVAFFAGMSEKDRKAHAERVLQWYDVSRVLHDDELRLWRSSLSFAPKRIQKLHEERQKASELAKSMPAQVQKAECIPIAQLAALATAKLTDIKKRKLIPHVELADQVLADRRPKWLPEYCNWILNPPSGPAWKLVYKLHSDGVIEPQFNSSYLSGLQACADKSLIRSDKCLIECIWRMLDDDLCMRVFLMGPQMPASRQWASDMVIRQSWAEQNRAPENWRSILLDLCNDGLLDRERLVSKLMSMFIRFNLEHSDSKSQLNVNWFQELHDELNLSNEQKLRLMQDYIRLFSCRNPKVLIWLIKLLSGLLEEDDFPASDICESIAGIFYLKGKEHAVAGLLLLKQIAGKGTDLRKPVAYATAEALMNESHDVQKRAITQLEKLNYQDDELCEAVRSRASSVGVMYRERVLAWSASAEQNNKESIGLNGDDDFERNSQISGDVSQSNVVAIKARIGKQSESANENLASDLFVDRFTSLQRKNALPEQYRQVLSGDPFQALAFRGDEFPRLLPGRELPLLNSLDELIFKASEILHRGWNPNYTCDEIEILIEAVGRFGAERPEDYLKRVEAIRAEAVKLGGSVWNDPVLVGISCWLTGRVQARGDYSSSTSDELRRRFVWVASRASKGKSTLLLSIPTHLGGWIDPISLIERLAPSTKVGSESIVRRFIGDLLSSFGATKLDNEVIADQCLALLRLAPDRRVDALRRIKSMGFPKSEFLDALRYALGDNGIRIGATMPFG